MSALFYRRAFSDHYTLSELSLGRIPSFEDWRRRLYLLEQRYVPRQPDHFLKSYRDERFPPRDCSDEQALGDTVWSALSGLADRFIERRMGRLHIKAKHFQDWHQLVPEISPLAVSVAFLVKEGRLSGRRPQELRKALEDEIGATALLMPCDPALDHLIETEGLSEIHMHLNGSTEVDVIWPDAVAYPREFTKELNESGPVQDLFENIQPNWNATKLFGILRASRRLRFLVIESIKAAEDGEDTTFSTAHVRKMMSTDTTDSECDGLWTCVRKGMIPPDLTCAPALGFVHSVHSTALIDEALFLFRALDAAQKKLLQPSVGLGLFYVFCTQRQIIELSVQQLSQYGFEQFQKFADNDVRNRTEYSYEHRFKQLNQRPPYEVLRHIEGRFAPKENPSKLIELISRIVDGAIRFRTAQDPAITQDPAVMRARLDKPAPKFLTGKSEQTTLCNLQSNECTSRSNLSNFEEPQDKDPDYAKQGRSDFELSLVAHFIKKKTSSKDLLFEGRRRSLRREADTLCQARSRYPMVEQLVRGVDAAANELDTPPDIFAPIFRQVKASGIPHATFHVGEDFRHLMGGIRAVDEAISFLELGPGDRIGHATALGILPSIWLESEGDYVLQTVWETLFDYVFSRETLLEVGDFQSDIAKLDNKICDLSAQLFGASIPPAELKGALNLRNLDVLEFPVGCMSSDEVRTELSRNLKTVVCDSRRAEIGRIIKTATSHPSYLNLYLKIMKKIRDDETFELQNVRKSILGIEALTAMQSYVIGRLRRQNIAIEMLLTSNIRISLYCSPEQHHLFRWLGVDDRQPLTELPKVCVGSDDPGIFSTNIALEFALIKSILTQQYSVPEKKVTEHLNNLVNNSRAFRFRPGQDR